MLPGDGSKSQRNLQGCYLSSPVSLWKGKLSDTSHLSFLWAQGCQVTVARNRFNCSSYYKELKLTECCLYTGKPCLRGQFPYKKAHPDKAQDIVQRHRPQSSVLLPGIWMVKSLYLANKRSRAVWDCLDPYGFPCGRAKVLYLKDTDCLKDIGKHRKHGIPARKMVGTNLHLHNLGSHLRY